MPSRAPFAIERIDHVLLLVRGMSKAVAFYRDVIGCTLERELPEYAMVELRAGDSQIDLVDVAAGEGMWAAPNVGGGRNCDHLCLSLRDGTESGVREHLAAHRVPIVEERSDQDLNGPSLSLYVHDPSENMIQLLIRLRS
jgi:glyoxylase I family protein